MAHTVPSDRRRWFQFGLGAMFAVVTVLCGILAYHANWVYARREAIRSGIAVRHTFASNQLIPRPPVLLRLCGVDGEEHLFVMPANFERVCQLFPAAEVLEYGGGGRSRSMTLGDSQEFSNAVPRQDSTAVFPLPRE